MRAPTLSTWSLAAALAGLGLSLVAVVRPALYRTALVSTDDRPARTDVARLERQVEVLAAAVNRLRTATAPPAAPSSTAVPSLNPPAVPTAADAPVDAPRYRAFAAPVGVTVRANHGALAVHNTNPELVGQMVKVTAERDDGEQEVLVVFVPEVEAR